MKNFLSRAVLLMMTLAVLLNGLCLAEEDKDLAITPDLDPAWRNILLLGSDSRTEEEKGRTDTMIILSVNAEEKAVCMTSLMRDTWVKMYRSGVQNKLNAANVFGGPEDAMATVNYYFGMNIEDYVLVDMASLIEIIDKLGGVDIALTEEEASYINKQMKAETGSSADPVSAGESVHLDGRRALTYIRTRSIDSDYQRTARQRAVLVALAAKLKDTSVFALIDVVTTMIDYVDTSLSLGELVDLGMDALEIDLSSVRQKRLPADGTYTTGTMDNGMWVIQPDFEKNQELLHSFIYESAE